MRTISLHNIRYELRDYGRDLWRVGDWSTKWVGGVVRHQDGRRFVVWSEGYKQVTVETEEEGRQVLLGRLVELTEGGRGFDII